ncbi:sulfatase [Haloferula rosea]|uniref:Sulfatase n=1 Tax=Haloferula rosea TaxID=490093 RepID=A0A934VG28_9BACT|nr:sulfatase [Haloferula rosea]MBK1828979.1 sulfatase [Haloferula rosea]
MKATYLFFALLLVSIQAEEQPPAASSTAKPNVLFLISDDLNSWLLENPERYTGKVIAPSLKGLAESGVNFKYAYTAAPVCSPSRTAFFSGVAPWKSGIYNNAQTIGKSAALNQDAVLSLAGLFKKAGYGTFGYGKITHGWDQKEHWDEKIGHKRDSAPPGHPLAGLSGGEQDWGPIHLTEEQMNDTGGGNKTIAILERKHERPFFLAYGLFNAHMPWYVPQKYFDMYPLDEIVLPEIKADDLDDLPPLARAVSDGIGSFADKVIESGKHKEAVQAYLATTTYVDTQIGRVLDALEKSPYKDNTIVVFFTDHGFHLGEKHHWQKTTLWEEGTHTLLMFRAPGVTKAGGSSERFVSLQDIYPTLAELCGLTPPDYVDGRSLVPLLKDPKATWESTAITGLCDKRKTDLAYISIRHELGRYTRYGTDEEEFYDTTKDPHEWTNQIDNPEYASVIGKLRAALPKDPAAPLPSALADRRGGKKSKEKKRGNP